MRAAVVLLVLLPASAFAEEAADVANDADDAMEAGRFELAARLYTRAYALDRDAEYVFFLGRAQESAGALAEAVVAYERYVAEAGDAEHTAEARRRARALRNLLRARGEPEPIVGESGGAGAAGSTTRAASGASGGPRAASEREGAGTAVSPARAADPGATSGRANAEGSAAGSPARAADPRGASDRANAEGSPASAAGSPARAADPSGASGPAEGSSGIVDTPAATRARPIAPWLVIAGGTAGLVAGGVLGALAAGKRESALGAPSNLEAAELSSSAKGLATAANVAYAAGAAVTLGGITWLVITRRTERPLVAFGPGSVTLSF